MAAPSERIRPETRIQPQNRSAGPPSFMPMLYVSETPPMTQMIEKDTPMLRKPVRLRLSSCG